MDQLRFKQAIDALMYQHGNNCHNIKSSFHDHGPLVEPTKLMDG